MLLMIIVCLLVGFVLSYLFMKDGSLTILFGIMLGVVYFVVAVLLSSHLGEVTILSEETYPVLQVQEYMTGGGRLNKVQSKTKLYYEVNGAQKSITREEPVYELTGENTITETIYEVNYNENEVLNKILRYVFFTDETHTDYTLTR